MGGIKIVLGCIMDINRYFDVTKPIAVYGAGSGGKKTAKILMDLQFEIAAFIDGDRNKWGERIFNVEVYSYEWLLNNDCNIVIASVKEAEIEQTLRMMNLDKRIVLKEAYIMNYLMKHMAELKNIFEGQAKFVGEPQFIISSETGLGRWGVEQYTRTVSEIYKERHIPVTIFTKKNGCRKEELQIRNIIEFEFDSANFYKIIKQEILEIINRLPCVVQENWQSYTLFAAIFAKKLFPGQVILLSMIHNEFQRFQRIVEFLSEEIDYIGAVSNDIVNKIKMNGIIDKDKILYKESPIEAVAVQKRFYEIDKRKPLRIAYGGRITKEQKRTHLIVPLMEKLIEKKVNFQLNMVGDGDYRKELQTEAANRKWGEKYQYLGLLENIKMGEFWNGHDIYINLSDYEGASLAMLEAMAVGCVPIVTKVSGTSEYIEHGVNGFLCNLDCVDEVVENIAKIEADRIVLLQMGNKARKTIADKCSKEAFYNYWVENTKILGKKNVHEV